MGNSLNKKILLCETQGLFGLNIGTFPRLLIVASYPCRICTLPHLLIVASMLHLKRSLISSVLGLVVNFKTMQQPTSDFSSNQTYTHRAIARNRASLIFLLQQPVLLFLLFLLLIVIQLSDLIIKYLASQLVSAATCQS